MLRGRFGDERRTKDTGGPPASPEGLPGRVREPPGAPRREVPADVHRSGEHGRHDAPKRPALIIGGWPEDQAASETLDKAKAILRQLDVPIDYSEMYVLGLKRGYAIIPIIHKRGETEDQRREDVQNTLQKVRRANVMLGMTAGGATPQGVDVPLPVSGEATQSPPGGESQAGGAGDGGHGTCPVWYRNERISSGTLDMPKGGRRPVLAIRLDVLWPDSWERAQRK